MSTLIALQKSIGACRKCVDAGHIAEANPVFRGREDHRLMIVGQAPGERGHVNARPYAGATGSTLRSWLTMAGFQPDDLYERFYLTSSTKCFPGPSTTGKGDRAPSAREIALCRDHLDAELSLVRPEIVIALGRLSASRFAGNKPLSQLVGASLKGNYDGHDYRVLVLPHPSGVSHWLNHSGNRERLHLALRALGDLREMHGW